MPGQNRANGRPRYEANNGGVLDTHRDEIVPLPKGVVATDPQGQHRVEDARDYAAELNNS